MTVIGFVGLGHMGGPMAANLVTAGHRVLGYDLAPAARDQAAAAGVEIAESARAAAEPADAVITMLQSGTQVIGLYTDALLPAAGAGTLFVDCSTIDVADAKTAAALAVNAGHLAVDAPVSGGVAGAVAGTLTFMVGGPDAAVAAAEPLLA
ncbi:MAG: NAD(P)-binding domain-containing protein, partial [Mycobacteriaceae bacterium]|nr:NAD(P)-binding domain-containing protein [Mycobacteriaceae bacterium]